MYQQGVTNTNETLPHKRILVVDDDADLLRVAMRVLKLHGYDVVGATSCAEAIALVEADGFDLLLTDVQMPEMQGDELAARLSGEHPDLRILFTSGHPEQVLSGSRADAATLERKHFIEKPYAMSELARRVEEVLAADPPSH